MTTSFHGIYITVTALLATILIGYSPINFAANLVEPNHIPLGKSQSITVDLSRWPQGTTVSIQAGGPYIKSQLHLPHRANAMVTSQSIVWLAINNTVHAYQANANGNFDPIAHLPFTHPILTLATDQHRLFIGDSTGRIYIYQIKSPASVHRLNTYQYPDAITAIAVHDSTLCIGQAAQALQIINIENIQQPVLLIKQPLSTPIIEIKALNNACLVLTHHHQILKISHSSKTQTKTVPSWQSLYTSTNHPIHDIALANHQLVLAHDATGVSVINSLDASWMGSYNKLNAITQVASNGQRIIAISKQHVLTLLDQSEPDNLKLRAEIQLPYADIIELAFSNHTAMVLTPDHLIQVDLSHESLPVVTHMGVNLGGSRRSFIQNHELYVADWFSGLHIYDIRIPRMPRLLANIPTPGSPKGVLVHNHIAYIADDDHGLQIVDVTDPQQPKSITDLPLPGLAYTLKRVDNLLYVAAHRGGFHIIDISHPQLPQLIGSYDTPGKAWAIEVKQDMAYVADDDSGLLLFDLQDKTKPQLVGQFNPGGYAEDVIIRDQIAYIAFFDKGLYIVDISAPQQPKLISHLNTPGNARGIAFNQHRPNDNWLYLASWKAGIHIIDLSNLQRPNIVGHYDTTGFSWGLSVQAHYAYVMDWWDGVKVLDITTPNHPQFVAQYQGSGVINDLAIKGNYAYLAKGSRGLQIYDITNALNPIWAAGLDLNGHAQSISVDNHQHALVALADNGLVSVDINNPLQPQWLSQLPLPNIDTVRTYQDKLLVTTTNGTLSLVNINSAQPVIEQSTLGYYVQDFSIQANRLATLTHPPSQTRSTINIIDMTSPPTSSNTTIELTLGFTADLIQLDHDYIYVVANPTDFYIYKQQHQQLQMIAKLPLNGEVIDFQMYHSHAFLSDTNQRFSVIDASNPLKPQLIQHYQLSLPITHLQITPKAVFFAGSKKLASTTLLPHIIPFKYRNNHSTALIPNNMPMNSYDLRLKLSNGNSELIHNAFTVSIPQPKKSEFTLDDLKKVMQQKNFSGKAP